MEHLPGRDRWRRAARVMLACAVVMGAGCGCERVKAIAARLREQFRSSPPARAPISDRERVLRKFGQPRERLGVGKAIRTEQGIRYNRKWNYYYSSRPGEKPVMRTIYFTDDRFTGSVVHQPDGTVRRENVRFAY